MFYFFVSSLIFPFESYCLEIFCNNLKVTLEHINSFVAQPGNVEDVDFIIVYKRFKFFWNIKAAEQVFICTFCKSFTFVILIKSLSCKFIAA